MDVTKEKALEAAAQCGLTIVDNIIKADGAYLASPVQVTHALRKHGYIIEDIPNIGAFIYNQSNLQE